MKIHLFFLTFLCCLKAFFLDCSLFEEKFERAEKLRQASLFEASIKIYEELLTSLKTDDPSLNTLYLSLAKAYFQNENYQKAIDTLKGKADSVDSLILIAMSLNQLKQYKETILTCESHNQLNNDQLIYELAYANFKLNNFNIAKKQFEVLLKSEYNDLFILSKIYLARIDLMHLKIKEADQHLSDLAKNLPVDHPLQSELAYLQGEVFFQTQDYTQAAVAFEKALRERKKNRVFETEQILQRLGWIYYQNKDYAAAYRVYLQIAENYPESERVAEALFNASLCLEGQNEEAQKIKDLRNKIYTEYPASKYADECYFFYYSYQDYIQGDRAAIKHLQSFHEHFAKSPLALNAYYLMGIDSTRDRKTLEGKWICKKNYNKAIDYFQSVEALFEELYKDGLLNERLDYFLTIRYLSLLEKGLCNLKIAEESKNPKKEIYLDYAKNIFSQIIKDFKDPQNSYASFMAHQEPYPHFQEESSYWLGIAYIKSDKMEMAKNIFSEMLEKYAKTMTTKGYFLSRVWFELGLISIMEQNYSLALTQLEKAEDAGKGKILNSEQKLDLWIQQSLCYQGLKQFDDAILILSKVINDDTISGLRLKAMLYRAEMYEKQGRLELARKQLEATSKKGGEWALKAKAKLEKDYGY